MRKTDIYCQISGIELDAYGYGDDSANDDAGLSEVFIISQVFNSLFILGFMIIFFLARHYRSKYLRIDPNSLVAWLGTLSGKFFRRPASIGTVLSCRSVRYPSHPNCLNGSYKKLNELVKTITAMLRLQPEISLVGDFDQRNAHQNLHQ